MPMFRAANLSCYSVSGTKSFTELLVVLLSDPTCSDTQVRQNKSQQVQVTLEGDGSGNFRIAAQPLGVQQNKKISLQAQCVNCGVT